MDQKLALEIMLSGESVLLTGPAGSGKTFILNQFISLAKKEGRVVSVTATTGLAATHLGGNTIHAWSGVGIYDDLPNNFFNHITKTRRETIEKSDVLIIDEISMLHDFRLDLVDLITRTIRKNETPFGGLQIILCGDFFQLPPVNRSNNRQGSFVVNSNAWQELDPIVCYLEEQHRQDDDVFLDILNALRNGDIRRHHAEKLLSRENISLDNHPAITELHTTNINVDNINVMQLDKIEDDSCSYFMNTTGATNYVETLKRSCLAQEELVLKPGALVMCIRNNTEKKYVNGSLGIVKGFEESTDYPIIELRNGKTVTMTPETWELRDGNRKRASITQIPLRLAWAITVHKSQGMTLDAARINLSKAFVEGMGYVALSRVKNLESLSLLGINKIALKVSSEALEIDQELKQKSQEANEKFSNLKERASKRKLNNNKKPKSNWHEKVAKMRLTHPNAFMPWSKEDDEKLKDLFTNNSSVNELSNLLGRQPGSIKARIKKHFGDDAID